MKFLQFPEGICLKVNVIARLEFELAYYDSAVQHFKRYTTGTFPVLSRLISVMKQTNYYIIEIGLNTKEVVLLQMESSVSFLNGISTFVVYF